MKTLKTVLLSAVIAGVLVSPAPADMQEVIELYKEGRYGEAAEILQQEEKDDKIYYYLGLMYYRAGQTEAARKAFLSSWYVNPDSKWGKAAYENYRHLAPSRTDFRLRGGVLYDSNVTYAPDYFTTTSDAVMKLGASLRSAPGLLSLEVDYDRKHNILDSSSFDILDGRLRASRGDWNVFAGAGISLFAFRPFYRELSGGLGIGPLSAEISRIDYLEESFDHLSNTAFEAGLSKKFGNLTAGYFYRTVNASDRDIFTYHRAYGSVEEEDYDFEEVEIEEGVFETFSYDSHGISLSSLFALQEGRRLRVGASAQRRFYAGKDRGYYSHWLNDAGQWHYWDDEEGEGGNWVVSEEEAPGEKMESSRQDTYLRATVSLLSPMGGNTESEIFYRYENNQSPRDTEPFFSDRNWQKHSVGMLLRYKF